MAPDGSASAHIGPSGATQTSQTLRRTDTGLVSLPGAGFVAFDTLLENAALIIERCNS